MRSAAHLPQMASPATDFARESIERALEKLLASSAFAGSDRLRAFLRFVVEERLAGRERSLKEAVIGNAIYGREPAYDPRIDSTVRVEARRLRSKLDHYYANEGTGDALRISLPLGGYVPAFDKAPGPGAPERLALVPPAPRARLYEPGQGAAVAFMPFRALSEDPEAAAFADSLTDEIMFVMVGEKGLRVLSQLTVLPYRDTDLSPAELIAKLGVIGLLQGIVRRDGDRLRVTIEYSGATGFVIFSDRFVAPWAKRNRLQQKIAATLLSRVRFDNSKLRAMQLSPTPAAVQAHARAYRARQLIDRQEPAALSEALDIFIELGEVVPDYTRAHSGMADCYCEMFRIGMIERDTAIVLARAAARRALECDAESIEAHTAHGIIAMCLDPDPPAAERWFRRALELGGNARAARFFAMFQTMAGQREEGEALLRQARSIEPFSFQQDIVETICRFHARRFAALICADRDEEDEPVPFEALFYTALAHIFCNSPDGARALLPAIERAAYRHPGLVFAPAELRGWLGDREPARQLLASGDTGSASAFGRAALAIAAGDDARALAELTRAIKDNESSVCWLGTDIRFDRMHGMPEFDTLLARR